MEKFIEYKFLKHNNTIVFLLDVKKPYPTPLQWTFAMEEFKEKILELKKTNNNFAFILDTRLMGLLSISQIKEFVNVLIEMSEFLESKLISSSVIADGIFFKKIFEIIKMFYKTKKPLKLVNSMEEATNFIDINLD